jgi:hypothetical protein
MMKRLSILVRVSGYGIILVSTLFFIVFLTHSNSRRAFGFSQALMSNGTGIVALGLAIGAVSIWVARRLYVEMKKRKIPYYDIPRHVLLFLREHHMFIGWLTLITATAHAVYYLLRIPHKMDRGLTGLTAWMLLAILASLGYWFQRGLQRKQHLKQVRTLHVVIAVVFLFVLILHI